MAHLLNPSFRERLVNLWAEREEAAHVRGWDKEKLFFKCMEGTRKVDRCYGKRRALERKERMLHLQAR